MPNLNKIPLILIGARRASRHRLLAAMLPSGSRHFRKFRPEKFNPMNIWQKTGVGILAAAAGVTLTAAIILNQKKFGKSPSGERLNRILSSPNYRGGQFQNEENTPQLAKKSSSLEIFSKMLLEKIPERTPTSDFHFTKTELKTLQPEENIFVWMGHSSYFLQVGGKKILVDPVFSGYASPFPFMIKSFSGSDLYTAEDIPELDLLIITHDHWDHLDYKTVLKLFPKTKKIATGLGTGEHLEYWGYPAENLIELNWQESREISPDFIITAQPARHFSGRGMKRNGAVWASFVLEIDKKKIYIGGDSGYGRHFKKTGERFGSIDLAILENGQYNEDWRYIHMLPGQQLQAMIDLNAARMIPVHNSKFALARHPWYEPLEKMDSVNNGRLNILFPEIGKKIEWENDGNLHEKWWKKYIPNENSIQKN